jgi:Niemann-Pick C1 protein
MHVLLRYFEVSGTRKERVIECLETMGGSIAIGGISTFLGILPLAFSKSEIFTTVFLAFLGLVILGCAHGLILLPVILSLIGPESQLQSGSGNLATNSASTGESEAESHLSAVLENQKDKPEQAICDNCDSAECEA